MQRPKLTKLLLTLSPINQAARTLSVSVRLCWGGVGGGRAVSSGRTGLAESFHLLITACHSGLISSSDSASVWEVARSGSRHKWAEWAVRTSPWWNIQVMVEVRKAEGPQENGHSRISYSKIQGELG